ncbi:hypothetical protein HTZ84_17230 [Haloterrigena sp. SYSU A558-1]|uniref:Uncharacterized protein n=1 Tax=Haloterrigena gelatinilytica TaxID=2741724 RepID=A0A8J8GLX6_9EURY|nr:hypothetical protein [Haloterrigena gelatinilytica]NUB90155.1 hypothetical protein [Haloterrigena gelatinilytica]NUC74024.1 hypothetical protein [Haloterrigena gelatinilytica]
MNGRVRSGDSLFRTRPVLWFLLAVTVPALGYVASRLSISGESLASAAPLGVVFGVVFAAVAALAKHVLE